jgi:hypothetical protein
MTDNRPSMIIIDDCIAITSGNRLEELNKLIKDMFDTNEYKRWRAWQNDPTPMTCKNCRSLKRLYIGKEIFYCRIYKHNLALDNKICKEFQFKPSE